jgi:uncharacterized protein (TIGR03663 family)
MESDNKTNTPWLDIPLSSFLPKLNIESLLIITILLLAAFSRFYDVGLRVMSHDEVNHVVPSWDLYSGRIYKHDPVTHGPLQFHMLALSYFMLGDTDFSSRVPSALFSVATVAVVLIAFRRYLGRSGAIIGGILFLISPYLLFYGRYTRNEAFVALFGVLMLYGVLRYLDRGDNFSLYLLTLVTVLHFTAKETSYIYVAEMLIFLAVLFFKGILESRWKDSASRNRFVLLLALMLLIVGAMMGLVGWNVSIGEAAAATAPAVEEGAEAAPLTQQQVQISWGIILALVAALASGIVAMYFLVRDLGWEAVRAIRSFDLLMLLGTLILPLLAAFAVRLVPGWDPLDYSSIGLVRTGIFVAVLAATAAGIGLWWKPRLWLISAAMFYGIFTIFYTTFFTNGQGFFTGLVGSLGYWLSQQGVERGSQPLYYYALLQIPVYEFLAALGALLALYFGLRHKRFASQPGDTQLQPLVQPENGEETGTKAIPTLALLLYWSVISLIAFSVAGERMPWLTVHIALPLLLSAGWGLGFLIDSIDWKKLVNAKGLLVIVLLPVFLAAVNGVFASLLGNQPPFQGNTLEQLQASSTFMLSLLVTLLSGAAILKLFYGSISRSWDHFDQVLRLLVVAFFGMLAIITLRTAIRAAFIDYDHATEYLVYAHAARGPKDVLEQVEEISRRTTGGLDLVVAYDNDGLYPYWWYLRDYPNHKWYTDKPTRDLLDAPCIIASEANFGKLDSIVKDSYVHFDYIRLWWPNQDYYDLTWERIWNVIKNPQMRTAVFNIWFNRDYSLYAELKNNDSLTLETWQPSSRMRFYVRKDIIGQIWNYGAAPVIPEAVEVDPYLGNVIDIAPDAVIGTQGNAVGQLQAPRGIAVAVDDSIYVADSQNHRIQHFSPEGEVLHVWGSFADAVGGQAPGGTFNEPWGVALGPDGSVFVADTWNHRIQKFTAEGQFLASWGYFGQAETAEGMWGPRGIAVDSLGRVYVTDTGNKRVVIFTSNGEFVAQFGTAGVSNGEFDEPVGLDLDENGNVYVADTWNQRVQKFSPDDTGTNFFAVNGWEIYGWFGQSLDNKPFLSADDRGNVFVVDPESYRILKFNSDGEFLLTWGDYSPLSDGFGLPASVDTDKEGRVWVADAGNHVLLRFTLP